MSCQIINNGTINCIDNNVKKAILGLTLGILLPGIIVILILIFCCLKKESK